MKLPNCAIVIDLDGTLSEHNVTRALFWHASLSSKVKWFIDSLVYGRAMANYYLSDTYIIPDHILRLRESLVKLLKNALLQNADQQILLATGAPMPIAKHVAIKAPFITDVIASDASQLCIGQAKAQELLKKFPDGHFLYIGDSVQDVPVWAIAQFQAVVRQENNEKYIAEWQALFPRLIILETQEIIEY